jgi:hypothetical protein
LPWAGDQVVNPFRGPQPHPYRVRVFNGNHEVLGSRRYLAALDLSRGPGLRATAAVLDELLLSLAATDGARGEDVRTYHLQVERWPGGDLVCHWAATTFITEGP